MASYLKTIGVQNLHDLELFYISNNTIIHPLILKINSPINSTFYPYLDYSSSYSQFIQKGAFDIVKLGYYSPIHMIEEKTKELEYNTKYTPNLGHEKSEIASQAFQYYKSLVKGVYSSSKKEITNLYESFKLPKDSPLCLLSNNDFYKSVFYLGTRTMNYLNSEQIEELWRTVKDRIC